MERPPISNLAQPQRQNLLDDLNYLNMAEIKSFCRQHSIPYSISVETRDGHSRKTGDDDRKGLILNRIRHFLQTGEVLEETRFPASVVCFDPLPENLAADHRLFYGQYDKTNRSLIALLKDLTDGKFKNGAVARILARDFWAQGRAPTFREYASAWVRAATDHTRPNAEWAFLSDRANKTAPKNWKQLRADKASKVIETLNQITSRS